MEYTEEIDLISQDQKYLIDYSNMQDGLISNQTDFQGLDQLNNILDNPHLGLPMLLPINIDSFEYSNNVDTFELDIHEIAKKIFNTNKIDYIGVKSLFQFGNKFCTGARPKESSLKIIKNISNQNQLLLNKIEGLKKEKKTIGAFQTRNIPHLGHEKIIELLLEHCDHVIINPVIGPKKTGDLKSVVIKAAYEFLSKNFYKNKISYLPVCANMFYAGPREALHHSLLRNKLGFTHFTVGRDHAGAEGIYHDNEAVNLVKKFKKKLGIKVITHFGSYYSKILNDIVVIKDDTQYNVKKFENISGTDFRENLTKKKYYKYARPELLNYLYTMSDNYFINY